MLKLFKTIISVTMCLAVIACAAVTGGLSGITENIGITVSATTKGVLEYTTEGGFAAITGCDKDAEGVVTIPSELDGFPVIRIGDSAFGSCKKVEGVKIPDTVQTIGSQAFQYCEALKSIVIPDSVTRIEYEAFSGCTSLDQITLPKNLTNIHSRAFKDTAYVNDENNWEDGVLYIGNHLFKAKDTISGSYSVKPGTISIASNAFDSCGELTDITIPDSVRRIGNCAFDHSGYYNNASNWKDGVLYIGNHLIRVSESIAENYVIKSGTITLADEAFAAIQGIKIITIPDCVLCIGEGAFTQSGLTQATLPKNLTAIEDCTFQLCSSLTAVDIPDSVRYIGVEAFYGCKSLKDYKIPADIEHICTTAFVGTAVESLTFPGTVKFIEGGSFMSCQSLKHIEICQGITRIYTMTFANCTELTEVVIPLSVTQIDKGAFTLCEKLTDVYYAGSESDRSNITILGDDSDEVESNAYLKNATWHYNYGAEPENPEPQQPVKADIIKGRPADAKKTYGYKTTVTYTADVPQGGSVQWYIDDKPAGNGKTLTVRDSTNSYTVKTVVTAADGSQTVDEQEVTISNTFFDKVIWFFRSIFNPTSLEVNQ